MKGGLVRRGASLCLRHMVRVDKNRQKLNKWIWGGGGGASSWCKSRDATRAPHCSRWTERNNQ